MKIARARPSKRKAAQKGAATVAIIVSSFTFSHGITFVYPVRPQIIGDVKHLQLLESLVVQGFVGRPDVRAVAPGAASAVNDDESVSGDPVHPLDELFERRLVSGRAKVFRIRDVGLGVGKAKADIEEEGPFARE